MGANDSTIPAAILAAMKRRREQARRLPEGETPHFYPTDTVGLEEHARRCRQGLVSSVTVHPKS